MERNMERNNGHSKEIQETLEGIHALWIKGKITLEQHNCMCYQLLNGATALEIF